jgi:hypothetical protein
LVRRKLRLTASKESDGEEQDGDRSVNDEDDQPRKSEAIDPDVRRFTGHVPREGDGAAEREEADVKGERASTLQPCQ